MIMGVTYEKHWRQLSEANGWVLFTIAVDGRAVPGCGIGKLTCQGVLKPKDAETLIHYLTEIVHKADGYTQAHEPGLPIDRAALAVTAKKKATITQEAPDG